MPSHPKKVQLFHTCLVNEIYPEVGMAVADVLESLGLEVQVPIEQTCCGQPAFNAGFENEARKIAKQNLRLLESMDGYIVIPSGSCGDMIIHQYHIIFEAEPALLARAEAVSARCFEFTQFLVDVLGVSDLGAQWGGRIAYHPSCHLLRGLKVAEQPRLLLERVAGLEIVDFQNETECCGFGGLFCIKNPEISGSMMDDKIRNLSATDAACVVSCDMGCMMHIEGGLHRKGSKLKVCHIAEILNNRT